MRHPLLPTLALLALAAGAAPAAAPPSIEPHTAGRPVRVWLADLADPDLLVREEAIEVLAQAGPGVKQAVPALTRLLKDDSPTLRTRAALALWRIAGQSGPAVVALAANMRTANAVTRREALVTLAEIGADAAPATPAILELLDDADPAVRNEATATLTRLGATARPYLVKALAAKDSRTRRNALQVFHNAGPALLSKDAIPTLTACLREDGLPTRVSAARLLWALEQTGKPVTDVLRAGLRSPDQALRFAVLNTIASSTARSKTVVPLLEEALKNKDLGTRVQAARALFEVEGKADRVMPVYLEALKNENRTNWASAIAALAPLGPGAAKAAPRLVEILKVRDYYVPHEVRHTLVRIGPATIPPLVELLKEPEPPPSRFGYNSAHETAVYALGQFGAKSAEAMVPLLKHADTSVRQRACRVIASVGPQAKDVVPKLVPLLEAENVALRESAVLALGNVGPEAKSVAPTLLAMVGKDTTSTSTRTACLQALLSIGPEPKDALPVCLEAIKDAAPRVRLPAVELLWRVEPKHKEIVPRALDLMRQPEVRYATLGLLQRMGPDAAKVVPAVVDALRAPDEPTRRLAVEALGSIGPGAKSAIPDLVILLRERDPSTRLTVLLSLEKVGAEPKELMPRLVAFIKETQRTYNAQPAIHLVRDSGPKAASAAPALVAVLHDPLAAQNHLAAAEALHKVAPAVAKKEAAPVLRRLVRAGSTNFAAAGHLLAIEPDDKDALKLLHDGLKSPSEINRGSAAVNVGRLGAGGKAFAGELETMLEDGKAYARGHAALALWQVIRDKDKTVPVLVALLKDTTPGYSRSAWASCLGEMGPAAKAAVPALRTMARTDSELAARTAATAAVKKIEAPPAKKAD